MNFLKQLLLMLWSIISGEERREQLKNEVESAKKETLEAKSEAEGAKERAEVEKERLEISEEFTSAKTREERRKAIRDLADK